MTWKRSPGCSPWASAKGVPTTTSSARSPAAAPQVQALSPPAPAADHQRIHRLAEKGMSTRSTATTRVSARHPGSAAIRSRSGSGARLRDANSRRSGIPGSSPLGLAQCMEVDRNITWVPPAHHHQRDRHRLAAHVPQVAPQLAVEGAHGGGYQRNSAAAWRTALRSMRATCPSPKYTTRSAIPAITALWVITTVVVPSSRLTGR